MNNILSKSLPLKRVNLTVTKFCNLHCRMCDFPVSYPWLKIPSLDKIKSVIDEAASLGAEVLEITGGEPMTRKDIYQIIAYARAAGLQVLMMTNGTLIGPSEAPKLIESGLTSVSFSLEGPEPLNDQLRGPGNYQKTLQAISHFLNSRSGAPDLKVTVGITLSRYNYQTILSFSKYLLEEVGVDTISVNPYIGGMLTAKNRQSRESEFQIPEELFPDLVKEIEDLVEYSRRMPDRMPAATYLQKIPDFFRGEKLVPAGGCRIPATFCAIAVNGLVFACWRNPPLGNIKQQSLTQIRSSKSYQQFQERALAGDCSGCLTSCYPEIY